MKRSKRSKRINYRTFASSGIKEIIPAESQSETYETELSNLFDSFNIDDCKVITTIMAEKIQTLKLQLETISDDIDDFMDENPIEHLCTAIEDLDINISRIEQLRSKYRRAQK